MYIIGGQLLRTAYKITHHQSLSGLLTTLPIKLYVLLSIIVANGPALPAFHNSFQTIYTLRICVSIYIILLIVQPHLSVDYYYLYFSVETINIQQNIGQLNGK